MQSDFDLAVHALVYLKHKACYIKSRELADNICTNPSRVRLVMAKLKRAALVETKEGLGGGYAYPAKRKDITLKEVAQAMDKAFIEAQWKSGSPNKNCPISKHFSSVMEELYGEINQRALLYFSTQKIADLEEKLKNRA